LISDSESESTKTNSKAILQSLTHIKRSADCDNKQEPTFVKRLRPTLAAPYSDDSESDSSLAIFQLPARTNSGPFSPLKVSNKVLLFKN
jgi:hypothetical protein